MFNTTKTTFRNINKNFNSRTKNQSLRNYRAYNKAGVQLTYDTLKTIVNYRQTSFLNRLDYWLKKCGKNISNQPGLWIYNTTHEWARQLHCSLSTVKRLIKSLEEQEILLSKKVNAKKYNQTKWYSIDYDKLILLLKINNAVKNTPPKKRTNRLAQNEPIYINKVNNYTNKSSKETKKAKEMIESWNKIFIFSLDPIKAYHNKRNRKLLLEVMEKSFNGNLNKWISYAKKVSSSQFLMGEKKTKQNFKATFNWLLKEETVNEILSGGYGVGDREPDVNKIDANIKKQERRLIDLMYEKLTIYIKKNVNHQSEQKIFDQYIRNSNLYKEDIYGLNTVLKHLDIYSILHLDSYAQIKNILYKNYLTKKYIGFTGLQIQELVKRKIQNLKTEKKICNVFQKMRKEIKRIESTYLSDNQAVIAFFTR